MRDASSATCWASTTPTATWPSTTPWCAWRRTSPCATPWWTGQGNFGSIDGDPPAAVRYTEARLSRVAEEMLRDINKDTVDFGPNYDDSQTEPLVLPAAFPFLLVNGSSGIAVGMATNIPPHNLREICGGHRALIDDPRSPIDELMKHRARPRLPHRRHHPRQEGHPRGLHHRAGQGHRAREGDDRDDQARARTRSSSPRSPTRSTSATLIVRIADLVKERKIDGISDLSDESDRHGMRIVIDLQEGRLPEGHPEPALRPHASCRSSSASTTSPS